LEENFLISLPSDLILCFIFLKYFPLFNQIKERANKQVVDTVFIHFIKINKYPGFFFNYAGGADRSGGGATKVVLASRWSYSCLAGEDTGGASRNHCELLSPCQAEAENRDPRRPEILSASIVNSCRVSFLPL